MIYSARGIAMTIATKFTIEYAQLHPKALA